MRLGEILVQQGRVTAEQVENALRKQQESAHAFRLGEWLVRDGILSEEDVLNALSEQFGLPVLFTVEENQLDPELVRSLPVEWARSRNMLPIRVNGRICLLTADPTRMEEQEDLALLLGEEFDVRLAPAGEIQRSIERCYFRKQDTAQEFLRDLDATDERPETPAAGSDDLLRMADQAPVARLVNLILLEALKANASDVHIEPFRNALRMRYRVDGLLYERAAPPKHLEAALISRLKVMGHLDIAEKRLPQDGTARVRVGEREIDIRLSTVPAADGERIVLRLLNRESTMLPLSDLGMSGDMIAHMRTLLREPYGVIWVTGPTGSGKTTTLYATLQELDTDHTNVMTIEDPIEYQLPTISQIAVKPKIGLTFARGLRHVLRQDPDVVLVGETRDQETAEIVVRASLTGHLVFSTLHTNDAAGAAVRLVDMGIEPYLVASATRACLAQRLIRKLCPHCKTETGLTDEERRYLGEHIRRVEGRPFWKAAGCPECLSGYRGRTGLFELMRVTPEIREAIRTGAGAPALRQCAVTAGMRTLLEDGLDKALNGLTSVAELIRVVGRATD